MYICGQKPHIFNETLGITSILIGRYILFGPYITRKHTYNHFNDCVVIDLFECEAFHQNMRFVFKMLIGGLMMGPQFKMTDIFDLTSTLKSKNNLSIDFVVIDLVENIFKVQIC